MERPTGKSLEAFVEFANVEAASNTLDRYELRMSRGRLPRIQQRNIIIERASYDEMMKALFPRAKNVTWTAGVPHINEPTEAAPSVFCGFLTDEEIFGMSNWAENPRRVCSPSNYDLT